MHVDRGDYRKMSRTTKDRITNRQNDYSDMQEKANRARNGVGRCDHTFLDCQIFENVSSSKEYDCTVGKKRNQCLTELTQGRSEGGSTLSFDAFFLHFHWPRAHHVTCK